ncbi:MAG: glycosyl hydrolase 53 family protein, partial [Gemmatimonadetes bacterium]|nr:glycosyl hydrolase 53 family protein [Gemmatimonadota bacterium]
FREGGRAVDGITALKAHGMNLVRLRLFLSPNHDEVQVNDLPYTIALAKRVKAAGLQLLLDFHYSDGWADPAKQVMPAAWRGQSIDQLEATVEAYTADVLTQFRAAGIVPELVQVGNEIDTGLLWPLGKLDRKNDSTAAHDRFGRLMRAGVRGVRKATRPADHVRIMVHFSQSATTAWSNWFYDIVRDQKIQYDIIGFSYYPGWHGMLDDLRANLAQTAKRYDKDVMVVETWYPWNAGWSPPADYPKAWTFPFTVEGQRDFTRALAQAVADVPGGRGIGVVWWYPEAVRVPGKLFIYGDGALALFDSAGRVLPAADALRRPAAR